jgi:hypothetical protein
LRLVGFWRSCIRVTVGIVVGVALIWVVNNDLVVAGLGMLELVLLIYPKGFYLNI